MPFDRFETFLPCSSCLLILQLGTPPRRFGNTPPAQLNNYAPNTTNMTCLSRDRLLMHVSSTSTSTLYSTSSTTPPPLHTPQLTPPTPHHPTSSHASRRGCGYRTMESNSVPYRLISSQYNQNSRRLPWHADDSRSFWTRLSDPPLSTLSASYPLYYKLAWMRMRNYGVEF